MKRILVVESGATKSEWRLLQDGALAFSARSIGFNPNVMREETIENELRRVQREELQGMPAPEQLYFYGAGINGKSQFAIMERLLAAAWPKIDLHIEHDLTAAARSTQREAGIVCILGTGSNSCLHRDYAVLRQEGGLGYLFGDEGSGMDLGRALVAALLRQDLPKEVQRFIEQQEGLPVYDLKIAILQHPHPNVRMARLAQHLDELMVYPEVRALIHARFLAFFDTTVCRYPDYQSLPVDVVGSIGWYFQDALRQAAVERDIMLGKFRKDPIDDLLAFHLRMAAESRTI